jgi:hypothetical protein
MPIDRNWTDLSFTPAGESPVNIRSATVWLTAADSLLDPDVPPDPRDIKDATFIKIRSSSVGDIPKLLIGQVGVFRGVWEPGRCQFTVHSAEVYQSEPGELILKAKSRDEATSPVSVSVLHQGRP